MISVDDYRISITRLLGMAPVTELPLEDCAGLVLAQAVQSSIALPPFINSAMDGYAVHASDIAGASIENPVALPVVEDIPAGRTKIPELRQGTAHRIMTGALVPAGADCVVMVEKTNGDNRNVLIYEPVTAGTYLRQRGEDVTPGTTILNANTVLGAAHLGLAAAVGLERLPVHVPPRVLVVSAGTELVHPPQALLPGQIYESNSVMLTAALKELGCAVTIIRGIPDEVEAFRAEIEPRLQESDLVITSGGVSAGAYEVVKDSLSARGVNFVKVAMQPGGPQGYGRWNGVPVVALPGNPVSVLVSFEAFLRPALLASLGHTQVDRNRVRGYLTENVASPLGKRQFRRASYVGSTDNNQPGEIILRGGPGSHLLASFAQSNCLVVIDENTTQLTQGSEVAVLLL